jgi:tripartite-type tricarboxylate transporter receptor subunit TctC
VAETVPDFVSGGWSILVAPRGTPSDIVGRINDDLRAALARPELVTKFEELGTVTRSMSPKELAAFVRSERAVWGPVVRQIGIAQQ